MSCMLHHLPGQFLLTRPLRDVTVFFQPSEKRNQFLLTRPLRDVTYGTFDWKTWTMISTHTPLAGRDMIIF